MNSVKKLAGQTAIYGVSSIVGRILGYLLVPIYVRVFLPPELGIYVEIYAYFTFLNILYTYGMETTFFRFANDHDNKSKVFNTSLLSLFITALVFSSLIYFNRGSITSFFHLPVTSSYIFICVALILLFDTIAVIPFASLRQKERPKKFAAVKVINIFINIGSNLFFLILCPYILDVVENEAVRSFVNSVYSENIGVGYIFISNLIASGVTVFLLSVELLEFRFDFDKDLWRKMIKYAMPLLIVGMAGQLIDVFDRTILTRMLPYSQEENKAILGIYGANVKLAVIMMLVVQSFKYAAEPFFFAQSKNSDAKETYAEVMKYFVGFCLLVFLGVTLYLDIFKYFIGREGSEYHEGLKVIPILLMGNLFLGIYYNLSVWYKLVDKTRFGAYMTIIGAFLTILINVAFIPAFEYYASAWAKFTAYLVMVIVSYFLGKKYYPVNYPIGRILFYFLVAVALYFISVLFVKELFPENLLTKLVCNTALIGIFVWVFIKTEKLSLKGLLKKKVK